MVILRNKKKRIMVYTLTHDTWCVGLKKCACTKGAIKTWESNAPQGVAAVRIKNMKYGPVLTLMPLERKSVPEVVLEDSRITKDIRNNVLQVLGVVAKGSSPRGAQASKGGSKKTEN